GGGGRRAPRARPRAAIRLRRSGVAEAASTGRGGRLRRAGPASSASVLELAPGGDGHQLDERALSLRIRIPEVSGVLDPRDVEETLLHAVIEPRSAEDELPEPVDERFALDE